MGRNSQTSLITPNKSLQVELQPRNEDVKQRETYKRVYFLQPRGHTMWPMYIPGWGVKKRPRERPQETHP